MMEQPMSIAVSAVSGQLGAQIVQRLMATGQAQIVGLARTPEKVRIDGLEVRPGEYSNQATLARSLSGIETLVMVSLNTPPDERTEQHRSALRAAMQAGVRRIIYTSVQGAEQGTAFSPVIQSNRQTEADIKALGFEWSIGRNGIYIEPDIDYIDSYIQAGEIANSAGDGRCAYTTRAELAAAYAAMALDPHLDGRTYKLHGDPLTQAELAEYLNAAFGTELIYRAMSVDAYRADRQAALGDQMGTIIAGIYEGIRSGVFDAPSDFEAAAGRPHRSWPDFFAELSSA